MRHIIDTPEGSLVIGRLSENTNDPLHFMFELDNIPMAYEKRLQEGIMASKEAKFNELLIKCPERLKKAGYESVDQIPEYTVFTDLNLKFSDSGNGVEYAEINRNAVDSIDLENYILDFDTSFRIDLSEQAEDLKWLALRYLEKIIFQKRTMGEIGIYIV